MLALVLDVTGLVAVVAVAVVDAVVVVGADGDVVVVAVVVAVGAVDVGVEGKNPSTSSFVSLSSGL